MASSLTLSIATTNQSVNYPQVAPVVISASTDVSINVTQDPSTRQNVVSINANNFSPTAFPNAGNSPNLSQTSVLIANTVTNEFQSIPFSAFQSMVLDNNISSFIPYASPGSAGVAKIGNTLTIDGNGVLNVGSNIANIPANFASSFQTQLNNKIDATTSASQSLNGPLNLVNGGDVSQTTISIAGGAVRTLKAQRTDFINALDFMPANSNDLYLALTAAYAQSKHVLVPPGNYIMSQPLVLTAQTDSSLMTLSEGSVNITVNNLSGPAITIYSLNNGSTFFIGRLRFIGGNVPGPIPCAIDFIGGSTSFTATNNVPPLVVESLEIVPYYGSNAFIGYGSWTTGISIHGAAGTLLGNCYIGRLYVVNSLLTGNTLANNSTSMRIGLVDFIVIDELVTSYAYDTIYVDNYCEGFFINKVCTVGNGWFLRTAPSGISNPIGNNLYVQKIWINQFEIATYYGGFDVDRISNSYLVGGEIVRWGDSGANNWVGMDLTDCFGWQTDALYIDGLAGTETGSTGIRLSTSQIAGQFNALHVMPNVSYIRVATFLQINARVAFCSFTNQYGFSASGEVNEYIDNGVENLISFNANGSAVSYLNGYNLVNPNGAIGLSVSNTPSQDVGFYIAPGVANSPCYVEAVSSSTGHVMPIDFLSPAIVQNGLNIGTYLNSTSNAYVYTNTSVNAITIPDRTPVFTIVGLTGTIATLTITMPANAVAGDMICVTTNVTITNLAFVTSVSGQTMVGNPTTMNQNSPKRWMLIGTSWFLI